MAPQEINALLGTLDEIEAGPRAPFGDESELTYSHHFTQFYRTKKDFILLCLRAVGLTELDVFRLSRELGHFEGLNEDDPKDKEAA